MRVDQQYAEPTAPRMDEESAEIAEVSSEEQEAQRLAVIESLGKQIGKKRDNAVRGRLLSGVETIWAEDEDYYHGIDDLNRNRVGMIKPAGVNGGLVRNSVDVDESRCTAFFNITGQFVDSAASRLGDILLPSGDWNFVVEPTSVPDNPETTLVQADATVQAGETRIKDWLEECAYHGHVRRVIDDTARAGTGVLKGPVPEVCKKRGSMDIVPVSRWVDFWNCFPDPGCGDSIHDGDYFFERELISARKLRELKQDGVGFLDEMIDKVLDEGPGRRHYSDGFRVSGEETADDEPFEMWHGYCHVPKSSLEAAQVDCSDIDAKEDSVPVVVVLVNETVIKAFLNPLEDGSFPYDFMVWQRVKGSPWGIGIARKGRVAQDMLNAAARAMMDNAGLSASPMIIVRRGAIYPADGQWTLRARKVFIAKEESDTRPVSDSIQAINIPTMQAELSSVIETAYKMMEEATGVLYLLQGQQGSAPDTVGGMELLNRNASAPLRRLSRVFDEAITEPHIKRYYQWLLQYGEDAEKGDMVIKAVGTSALVEREVRAIETQQLLAASVNPAFGLSPEKTMTELLKMKRLTPERFMLDEQEKQDMAQQQAPPAPAVQAAQIRAQAQVEATHIKEQSTIQKAQIDSDRDTAYNDSLARRDQMNAELRMQELTLKRDLAMLDYANKKEITLEQVKAKLADKVMSLKVQKELAMMDARSDQVATPPNEPPGRADNGQAFYE